MMVKTIAAICGMFWCATVNAAMIPATVQPWEASKIQMVGNNLTTEFNGQMGYIVYNIQFPCLVQAERITGTADTFFAPNAFVSLFGSIDAAHWTPLATTMPNGAVSSFDTWAAYNSSHFFLKAELYSPFLYNFPTLALPLNIVGVVPEPTTMTIEVIAFAAFMMLVWIRKRLIEEKIRTEIENIY